MGRALCHLRVIKTGAGRINIVHLVQRRKQAVDEERREADSSTYSSGAKHSVQLAAGDNHAKCLGKGTVSIDSLSVTTSVHVKGLNSTLVSV